MDFPKWKKHYKTYQPFINSVFAKLSLSFIVKDYMVGICFCWESSHQNMVEHVFFLPLVELQTFDLPSP